MTRPDGGERLLGNDRKVIAVLLVALLICAAVILGQLYLRRGSYDPYAVTIFNRLFLFEDYPAAFLYIGVLMLGLAPQVQRLGGEVARWLGEHVAVATASFLCVLAIGARFVYLAHPLSMDEYAPVLQSEIFASGALLGRFPPALIDWLVYPPFQNYFIQVSHRTGEIASSYWPGFALLLTPFTAIGVPWLCNPVLGALSLWVIIRIAREITLSAELAGAAALLAVGSAAFVVNSITFYSMTAHLLCNGVFVLLLLQPTPVRAALAGFVGGLALTLHNPVPHILFATPWVLWLMWRPDRWRVMPALFAGYLPWIVFVGFGWRQLLAGLADGAAQAHSTAAHGRLESALRTFMSVFERPSRETLYVRAIGLAKLWLWAAPALVLVAALGFWRSRANTHIRLLFCSAALTLGGYFFVSLSQGHGWGYRYFHSAWFVLPILAVAIVTPRPATPAAGLDSSWKILRFAEGAALGALLVIVPYYLWQVHAFMSDHLAQLPRADRGVPRIEMINPITGYYAQDLVQNDPFLRAPVIRMVTHGRVEDERMIASEFPGLVRLSHDRRGSVWGYAPEGSAARPEASGVVVDQKR